MKPKLIILGSGSSIGVPRIDGFWGKCKKNTKNTRTRCSAIIIKGSNSVLIDTSPDVRTQFINNKIKDVSSVIFTHEHADQTNGLFELRPFFWKYKKKINVYGNSRTIKYLERSYNYLFKKISDYPPILKSNVIKKKISIGKRNEKIYFKTISVSHGKTTSLVYIFEKTAYVSDSNDLSIINAKELKNLNYLIIDCLKFKKHPSHFNLEQALFVHYKLKPKKTILTNLHHDIDYNFLKSKLPKNVSLAFDNLQIKL
jgi:phosphoribosyl 1,2-cyclic phosphate phosphodiesterase